MSIEDNGSGKMDEKKRRVLQEYIFNLEEAQERAEELAVAHNELNKYRNYLEELVKERTVELERTNAQLRLEIIERQKREEALRELGELESSILSAIPHAVVGLKARSIIFANDGVERVFGWKPEELIGKSTRILYKTDREYAEYCNLYSILEKQQLHSEEFHCCHKDGGQIICRINAARVGQSLKERQIVIVFEDITEQKKLESYLMQSQKMEAIGTLAGGIAHDINNILMGIQGYASLALLSSRPSDANRETFIRIEEQVKSGASLTRQLLGFARRGRYEVKPMNINELLKKTSSLFGRTKKEIVTHEKCNEDVYTIEADQGQMEQVFLNLFVNAWQAMPGGGDLFLETDNIDLHENIAKMYSVKSGKYVVISVSDTGTGMDVKTKERIFEPFFTTKEMGRGTGLGLASAYGIIKNHGGFIDVFSELGHGSTFKIYLPASDKAASKTKPSEPHVLKGSGTILLIDDEETIIEITSEILKFLGYTVLTANGGKDGLNIYDENKSSISLVILDMIMPEMGGEETFKQLKIIDPDVKILLSTGYSMSSQTASMLNQGRNAFIQKPFTVESLSVMIRKIMDA
ncbi:MAG: response regulator [Syntrophales bacterium]|nr:response regulator [Syntrophales bacterium]